MSYVYQNTTNLTILYILIEVSVEEFLNTQSSSLIPTNSCTTTPPNDETAYTF